MKLRPINLVCFSIFCTLLITSLALIYQGPLSSVISGKTTVVQSYINVAKDLKNPVKWPTLMICKNPRDKSKAKFEQFVHKGLTQSFASEQEFNELREQTYFTNPKEIVYALR